MRQTNPFQAMRHIRKEIELQARKSTEESLTCPVLAHVNIEGHMIAFDVSMRGLDVRLEHEARGRLAVIKTQT